MHTHVVSFGLPGYIGRFASSDGYRYARGSQVVCRTPRGLEIGRVLQSQSAMTDQLDGSLLRAVTSADELLLERIERHRNAAFAACHDLLAQRGASAVLVDVEHLFDGQSLIFYFLGETDPSLNQLTEQLADEYESKVQFQQFTQTLTEGCGPHCGTEEVSGQGCSFGGCSTCAVASACHQDS